MSESNDVLVRGDGNVETACEMTLADFRQLAAEHQIEDVSALVPGREGAAVRLAGILARVQPQSSAQFIGFHAAHDDFHASVPLDAVRDRAIVIYANGDQPLTAKQGGPVRIFIPDHAACNSADVDECANVKFVDHIELTVERGFDNRPDDEDEHAELHARQEEEH